MHDNHLFRASHSNIDYAIMRCKNITKNIIRNHFRIHNFEIYQFFKKKFNDLTINFEINDEKDVTILKLRNFSSKQRYNEFFFQFTLRKFSLH